MVGEPTVSGAVPLAPLIALSPLEKWAINFVELVALASNNGCNRYILVAIDYATKWAEAEATKHNNAQTVARFLYAYTIPHYGCSKELISDRGTHSVNVTIATLTANFMIKQN